MFTVGVIGYGVRMRTFVGALLATGKVKVSAIADPDTEGALARAALCGVEGAKMYPDAKTLLENERPDGVLVGTRC